MQEQITNTGTASVKVSVIFLTSTTTQLFVNGEHEQRESGDNRYVLLVADAVADRTAVDRRAELRLPQELASARVQRLEVAFAPAGEEQVRSRREDAALRDIGHLELPFFAARARLERDDRAVTGGFGPRIDRRTTETWCAWHRGQVPRSAAHEVRADFVLRRRRRVDARVVLPRGNVEEARPRAERRRVPVRPALIPRIRRLPVRLRRLLRAPA